MIELPAIRWGEPYRSLEVDEINHFYTGEPVARLHTVGAGIVRRDSKKARNARHLLQAMSPAELIEKCNAAGELFESGTLTVGDSRQSPNDFVQQQSATTGMPISMCKANVKKNAFVLKNIGQILDCLTRGLEPNILARGYGEESRGVTVSSKMLAAMQYSLVCTAITNDDDFRRDLIASTEIDRLNLGPIPTPQLDWLQPHEGNLIEFLYRSRALQLSHDHA